MLLYIDISSVSYVIPLIAGVAVGVGSWIYVRYRKAKSKISKALGIDENAGKEVEGDVAMSASESNDGANDLYLGNGDDAFDEDVVITDVDAPVVPLAKRAKNSYGVKIFADGRALVLNLVLKGNRLPASASTDEFADISYSPSGAGTNKIKLTVVKSNARARLVQYDEALVHAEVEFDLGNASLPQNDGFVIKLSSDTESGERISIKDACGKFSAEKELKWRLKGYLSES